MSKIKTIVVFAAGYIVGARAGHGRYEEIKNRVQELWGKPAVQDQMDKVSEQVGKVTEQAKHRLPGFSGESTSDDDTLGSAGSSDTSGPSGSSDKAQSPDSPSTPSSSGSSGTSGTSTPPAAPRPTAGQGPTRGAGRG